MDEPRAVFVELLDASLTWRDGIHTSNLQKMRAEWLARYDAAAADVRTLVETFDAIDYDVDGEDLVEDLKAVLGIQEDEAARPIFGSPEWEASRAERQRYAEALRERWRAIRIRLGRTAPE